MDFFFKKEEEEEDDGNGLDPTNISSESYCM